MARRARGRRPALAGSTIAHLPEEVRERAALVALLRLSGGWPLIACDLLARKSAVALLDVAVTSRDMLLPGPDLIDELIEEAAVLMWRWKAEGVALHTVRDPSYPPQLREIRDPAPLVFTRGRMADDTGSVAVVGTRQASERGLAIATEVASSLARHRVTVVSGLAAGIDTAAHRAALAAGGRTVAVIGTGIQRYHPAANRDLQDRIAHDGLVLSRFWPDALPRRRRFLLRNAVMSRYAAATVVVEGGERSGARNQARLALQHRRPVVLLKEVLVHEWARALSRRSGVAVAGTPGEAVEAVGRILVPGPAECPHPGPVRGPAERPRAGPVRWRDRCGTA
jgi:DNA processing protein